MITLTVDVVHLCKPCEFTDIETYHIAFSFTMGKAKCWVQRVNQFNWPMTKSVGPKIRDSNIILLTLGKLLDYSVSKKSRCNVNINTVNSLASHDVVCKKMQMFIGNILCPRSPHSCGGVVLLLPYGCIIQSNKTKLRSTRH